MHVLTETRTETPTVRQQKLCTASAQVRGGGQGRGRTADLPLFRRTLIPTELPGRAPTPRTGDGATQTGLEPATFAVTGRRANQLRHWALRVLRTPNGIRTRAAALKGRCPRPLDDGGLDRRSRPRPPTAVRWEPHQHRAPRAPPANGGRRAASAPVSGRRVGAGRGARRSGRACRAAGAGRPDRRSCGRR